MRQTNNHTNPDLLQSIADGDEPAFRVLFDQYHARVFDYLVTITKSREAAEELVMDIFLKLWLGREWIASIENIEAFLRKVAYNKAMDFLRHTARSKKMQAAIAVEMAKLQSRTPEEELVDKDYTNLMRKAVQKLSPQRRLVYKLSHDKGLTYDEIANELNLSTHTVSNHKKAALKFIRTFLKKENFRMLGLLWLTFRTGL